MKKIAVGMSGGVDSSVAAYLLQQQGHDVIGVYMKNWDDTDPMCPGALDSADARAVADTLSIPFYSFDFQQEYQRDVFGYFLDQNSRARTPNPDILCNRYVKFGALLRKIQDLGYESLATGHYAEVRQTAAGYQLVLPTDRDKDQTYFLSTLTQDQLSRAVFPLGTLTKSQVRAIAADQNLVTADKKDSTGICFVGERHYREFLQQYIDPTPGEIRDLDTQRVIGQHQGLAFYTIGQRRDLGIGGVRGFGEAPFFVIAKDPNPNVLLVSQDQSHLLSTQLQALGTHWISGSPPADRFSAQAKVRYRTQAVSCQVTITGLDTFDMTFDTPVRAITPGQWVVIYQDDVCLGGGEIL